VWLAKKTERLSFQLLYQNPARCVAKECGGRGAMENVPHKGVGHQPPHFGSTER